MDLFIKNIMAKADITVLISVRNEEAYIGPTIKSILSQTYLNFELWVIDDGSTDKTWTVIKSFQDKRIRPFHFKESTGMTPRLNWAVPQIKTEFVARMDSHNLADKTRLKKQHDFMLKNPKVMVLGSNFIRINETGKTIMETNYPTEYKDIKKKLMEKNIFKHGAMFIRRDVYDAVGLYDPYFKLTQDYDFILRVAGRFPVANLKEPLVTEIYRSQNMTQKHRIRSAWEALCSQWNALTKYGYPVQEAICLIRGTMFFLKSSLLAMSL